MGSILYIINMKIIQALQGLFEHRSFKGPSLFAIKFQLKSFKVSIKYPLCKAVIPCTFAFLFCSACQVMYRDLDFQIVCLRDH